MRLGEILIERGVIEEAQLKKALDAQLIYGAHLGTCLIEQGFVEESVLGRTLADIFDVGYARSELLDAIPPHIIEKLPQRTAEKHQAVPFDLKGKTLQVAMTDPKNIVALDALRFATGHAIESWVAPEVRIFQALERYYGIPRRLRYIALCVRLDQKAVKKKQAVMAAVQGVDSGRYATGPLVPILPVPKPHEETMGAVHPAHLDDTASYPRLKLPADVLTELSDQLSAAERVRDVVEPVMRWATSELSRCILFRVTAGVATICDSRGVPAGLKGRERLRFDVAAEPIFKLLFGEPSYKGPLPPSGVCNKFYETLGMEQPGDILIVPGYVNDALVAILYGDVPRGTQIRRSMEEYRRLTRKLALGLTLIGLKREIRSA